MRRYCVRFCLFDGLTDSNELFGLLDGISSAGGIETVWRSDGNIFVDVAAPANCPDCNTVHWCNGFAERMVSAGFNAVAAPSQL